MHKLLFLFATWFCLKAGAQENLVLNPSFEDTASMGDGYPYLITENWWNPNGYSTDYYTPFCEQLCCGGGIVGCVPFQEGLGWQVAQEGTSYLGLVNYESTSEGKEYAKGILIAPLQKGELYCVGIWISLADSSGLKCCDFQISFTTEPIVDGQALNLMLQNGVNFNLSEIDTSSWYYFEGTYMALGGEQYVYIGSNTPNSELTCVEQASDSWLWNTSYVLVDNISVRATNFCGVSAANILKVPSVIIYPNPTTGIIEVKKDSEEMSQLKIYGYNGILLRSEKLYSKNQRIDISNFSASMYMFEISVGNHIYRSQVFKE